MISRRYSDRTARTDSAFRRPTVRRGIKKRGILPSFGDLVLPLVSVAAVGLLILAGRQFFINGIKTSPGISSTRAYAESPALIAERERRQEEDSVVNVPVAVEKDENPALDAIVKQEAKQEVKQEAKQVVASVPENISEPKPVKPKPQPAKAQPKPKPQSKPEPRKAESKKSESRKPEPQKKATSTSTSTPSSKQWRVQIGAYTSKAGAQEAVKKLKKAGYNAVVYSNPASKHHKVWVSGGNDKQSAQSVVNSMKKLGYGSSFAFPPSK